MLAKMIGITSAYRLRETRTRLSAVEVSRPGRAEEVLFAGGDAMILGDSLPHVAVLAEEDEVVVAGKLQASRMTRALSS